MASVALDPAYRRITVEEFLEFDYPDWRAELVEGLIYMMAGGSEEHSRISGNIFAFLLSRLRGSGCRPYGPDFGTRTGPDTVRLPDVSVHCGNPSAPENAKKKLLGDPIVVFEVLSPSTATNDQKIKLEEYRSLAGTRDIVLVDPSTQRVRHARRTDAGEWLDGWLPSGADVEILSLNLVVPHVDMFAND